METVTLPLWLFALLLSGYLLIPLMWPPLRPQCDVARTERGQGHAGDQ